MQPAQINLLSMGKILARLCAVGFVFVVENCHFLISNISEKSAIAGKQTEQDEGRIDYAGCPESVVFGAN